MRKERNFYIRLISMYLVALSICFYLNGCTLSVTMVHTQGYADDVVEEQQSGPDIKSDLEIPMSAI